MCTQVWAKDKSINAKDFKKELLEIHLPKLEKLYGITFDIKGATQLIIRNGQDTNNIRNGKATQNKNHQQNNTLEKKQTLDNTEHNEQQAGISKQCTRFHSPPLIPTHPYRPNIMPRSPQPTPNHPK